MQKGGASSFILNRNMRTRFSLLNLITLIAGCALGHAATGFAPLEQWKAALAAQNAGSLRSFYSDAPPARVNTTGGNVGADSEVVFWTEHKASSIDVKITDSAFPQPGIAEFMLQAAVRTPAKHTLNVLEEQVWQQQNGIWRIIIVKRDLTKLAQPVKVDEKIYPTGNARDDIRAALGRAAQSQRNVLVVFGADWCYDCHVLDKAFQRPDVSAVLSPNYEVVHVDVGEGDKNQDLMNEYQVPMKRGIPALAVLDSSGKLLYSQKNGEFERARALGPEDLLQFLRKWKPQAR